MYGFCRFDSQCVSVFLFHFNRNRTHTKKNKRPVEQNISSNNNNDNKNNSIVIAATGITISQLRWSKCLHFPETTTMGEYMGNTLNKRDQSKNTAPHHTYTHTHTPSLLQLEISFINRITLIRYRLSFLCLCSCSW